MNRFTLWKAILAGSNMGRAGSRGGHCELTEQEMLQRFAEMMPQLVTWADAGVITRFTTFRRAAISSGRAISALFAMEEVYRAIRKDLGHDDNRLKKGDILGLFVNDIDKYL